ncbi:MAG: hypothetical protein ACTJHT_09800 [Sphingobacterium sp.]|uniref:hypothetical protein n=1 Tax=Sphingobacterium sp. JB170 TaxID=1434842 RepID=UPI00097E83F6|nr:hypothetical protein [Sphingobacterium sp. JB170]SJN31382.1 hypothetical protein FM107_06860 [Sphingobacterium sp. JB170]
MKNILIIFVLIALVHTSYGQQNSFALGFYGEVQLEDPSYNGAFGIQGKYDFTNHSGVQAQVYGRNGYVAVGADYILSILDRSKTNFQVFIGGGVSQDFYRYNDADDNDNITIPESKDNFTVLNGQAGFGYFFPDVNLSVYTGYKLKYNTNWDEVDPNYVMLGVRYHLW